MPLDFKLLCHQKWPFSNVLNEEHNFGKMLSGTIRVGLAADGSVRQAEACPVERMLPFPPYSSPVMFLSLTHMLDGLGWLSPLKGEWLVPRSEI